MQAPFIPPYNITLYLLPIVLFLCHSGHPDVVRATTDGDNFFSGHYDRTSYILDGTSSDPYLTVQESISSSAFQKTIESQPNVATDAADRNIESNVDKSLTRASLENRKNKYAPDNQRMKRTVVSQSDLNYADLVTHKSQLFLSKKDVITGTRHNTRGSDKRTLPSDFMMRIFECFTNSSCEHPRATMVRSFPNELNTGKVAANYFSIWIYFEATLLSF